MHLDALLLKAHAANDKDALVLLYRKAANIADTETARGFYLTHAYVFALEIGHQDETALREVLIEMGRETPV